MRAKRTPTPLPNVPEWTDKEKLAGEKELLGFWVTGHPLDRYMDKVARTRQPRQLAIWKASPRIPRSSICGVLTGITRKRNREGKPWCVMRLEDRTGSVEAWCFATNYERLASQVIEDTAVMVRGLVLPEENTPPKLSVQDIVALDNARIDLPGVIAIRVWIGRDGGVDRAAALEELFKRKPGPTSVRLQAGSAARFLGTAGRAGEGPPRPRIQGCGREDLRACLRGKSGGLNVSARRRRQRWRKPASGPQRRAHRSGTAPARCGRPAH